MNWIWSEWKVIKILKVYSFHDILCLMEGESMKIPYLIEANHSQNETDEESRFLILLYLHQGRVVQEDCGSNHG